VYAVPSTTTEPAGVAATVIETLTGEDVVMVEVELVVVVAVVVVTVVSVVAVLVEFEVVVLVVVVCDPIVNTSSF
jgi:hypothetical protein